MQKKSKVMRAISFAVTVMLLFVSILASTESVSAATKLKVTVTKKTIYVGQTAKLNANKNVKWSVSKKNIVKLTKDLYTYLAKEKLSIIEKKRLYYLLHTKFLHINNIKDFSKVNRLRLDLLKKSPLDSIRDYKKAIYEEFICNRSTSAHLI